MCFCFGMLFCCFRLFNECIGVYKRFGADMTTYCHSRVAPKGFLIKNTPNIFKMFLKFAPFTLSEKSRPFTFSEKWRGRAHRLPQIGRGDHAFHFRVPHINGDVSVWGVWGEAVGDKIHQLWTHQCQKRTDTRSSYRSIQRHSREGLRLAVRLQSTTQV